MFFLFAACTVPEFEQSVLWSGYHYEWEELSHRIALVHTELHEDATSTMGMIGGDWSTGDLFSDALLFRMHQQHVSDPYFRTINGSSSIVLDGDAEQTLTISLEEDVVGIALQGFQIKTDVEQTTDYPADYNPAHGYTSAGIYCSVNPDLERGTAEIVVQVDWGPQDRSVMNEAMLHAKSEVTVYWAQIKNKTEPTTEILDIVESLPHEPPFSEHEIPAQEIMHESNSVVGIRSFSLALADQDGSDMGSYWRTMGVEVTPTASGSSISLQASNSSLIEEIPVEFSGTVALDVYSLSHNDSTIEHHTIEDGHEVGTFEFPAP